MLLLDPHEYRLCVVGNGIELAPLRAACARLGVTNVVFTGHVQGRALLADYFAAADIFIHPNPREPFGIAPLEAMASGLALVAPNAGGVTSYANSGNAWLSAADAEAFAQSIRTIRHGSADDKLKRTAAARVTAEAHGWPNVTKRYLQLYRELDAVTRGTQINCSLTARSYSTPGDGFGREVVRL
jgi:glycosyltransferase involved in cell wall biosynthesis